MRVLIACEFSGVVREAFRARGHEAWSCDLLRAEGSQDHHFQSDVRQLLTSKIYGAYYWDLMIAHPPCTHLAVSGARYFAEKRADGRQQAALDFVRFLLDAPVPRIALENPVGVISTQIRKPDQIIQPWQFGHPESKTTCLWLKGLPLLMPTKILPKRAQWTNQTPSGQNKLGPSPDRWKLRSATYQGIADAMAEQWGTTTTSK